MTAGVCFSGIQCLRGIKLNAARFFSIFILISFSSSAGLTQTHSGIVNECLRKYQVDKANNVLNGLTWMPYFNRCRAEFGAWTVFARNNPMAVLAFDKAQVAGLSGPDLISLNLSCGEKGRIVYRVQSKQSYKSFSVKLEENTIDLPLGEDGSMSPPVAEKFVSTITPLINDYDKHQNRNQYVRLMTPNMSAGEVNLFGFKKAKDALRLECQGGGTVSAAVTATNQLNYTNPNQISQKCVRDGMGSPPQCNCADVLFQRNFGPKGYEVFMFGILKRTEEQKAAYQKLSTAEAFNFGMGVSMALDSANRQCNTKFPTMQSQSLFR